MKNSSGKRSFFSIRKKMALIIFGTAFLVMTVIFSLTWYFGRSLLVDTLVENFTVNSHTFAVHISELIGRYQRHTYAYANSPLWQRQIFEVNAGYEGETESGIEKKLEDIDDRWLEEDRGSVLSNEYLTNYLSQRLQAIIRDEPEIAAILITDKYGGLVAASQKPSKFYFGADPWWEWVHSEKGREGYVGEPVFSVALEKWVIPIANPIFNEKEELVGVSKFFLDTNALFKSLDNFKVGKTGHAVIIDSTGYIVYHRGLTPMSQKIARGRDLTLLLASGPGRPLLVESIQHENKKNLLVMADIPSALMKDNGIQWKVIIALDQQEAFLPLQRFIRMFLLIFAVILALSLSAGFILGNVFTRPVNVLLRYTESIQKGVWDTKFDLRTQDEIQELGESFRNLMRQLQTEQRDLMLAKQELESLSNSLDDKVKDRTKELTDVQEASLNILEDLTEVKDRLDKYSHELERAVRIKSDFTSMVSHELRTPLTAIKESIAIVFDGIAGEVNDDQKDFLGTAKRNVDRLVRLINDILDFAKLESGRMAFRFERSDMGAAIFEVHKSMMPLASQKGLVLALDIAPGLPMARFDWDRIIQVLTNLVNNAIKFTERGSITMRAKQEADSLVVSVQDTGPGIRQEDLGRLFQKFEQLEGVIERKTGGTGLGLAISKEIVEKHQGRIWVESEPGKGSSFNFSLPLEP